MPQPVDRLDPQRRTLLALAVIGLALLLGMTASAALAPANTRVAPFDARLRINPNTADASELTLLPGIGVGLAQRIITARRERSFDEPRDLLTVSGIGPVRLERIAPNLTFETPSPPHTIERD